MADSEYRAIAQQFAEAKLATADSRSPEATSSSSAKPSKLAKSSAKRTSSSASRFKSQHLCFVGFFLWILFLHVAGIYFFTRGFLLTRLVLEHKSGCKASNFDIEAGNGCWYPKTFDKAIVIIIDALRYDFTVPRNDTQHYHNALTILHETAVSNPQEAFLRPFIADPPTTTLQRLKALTTGTLPTFVDAGSNFAGTAIEEDNLLAQLKDRGKKLVHLGDDTWHSLFPGYFDANLTHAYDSFNVWDLHTVDNGVTEHLLPLLNQPAWDVVFAHYLGVDHAGHRYGPDHPAMGAKLRQMDQVVRDIVTNLDAETLLVVMGDHGMDAKGDHGGESDDEVEAALWMFSKKGVFGGHDPPPVSAKTRPLAQIDLVPTLSLLLGLPIPFNNLGAPIEEAFGSRDWKRLAEVNMLTADQIQNYQQEYALARGLSDAISEPQKLWEKAKDAWTRLSVGTTHEEAALALSEYQVQNLRVCRDLWARFDVPSMTLGILILGLTIMALLGVRTSPISSKLGQIGFGTAVGSAVGVLLFLVTPFPMMDLLILGSAFGGLGFSGIFQTAGLFPFSNLDTGLDPGFGRVLRGWPELFDWYAVLATVLPSIGFASNSYTIWEDEILLFFLGTFGILSLVSSARQASMTDAVLGIYHSGLFLLITRLASLSRLCREEQMPNCRSTYYSSATSSTSASWQLIIPFAVATVLPTIFKSFYQGTKSYEGSATYWLGYALRLGLFGAAIFWTLDAADNGEWFGSMSHLKTVRIGIARMVLGLAFAAGTSNFIWAPPCIRIETTGPHDPATKSAVPKLESRSAGSASSGVSAFPISSGTSGVPGTSGSPGSSGFPGSSTISIFGFANAHGSRYFLLVSTWLIAIALVTKPMGNGVIGLLGWQILSLVEIIDTNDLSGSSVGPVVLGLMGNYYFFKTGHQATLASIQWDTAFLASKTVSYAWSPLLVLLNTCGAHILSAIAVPLVVLWKQHPKKANLLGDTVRAMIFFLAFHSIINLATTMWAAWLRRHLMLYRIFSPRFMTGAAVLLVVDVIGTLVALGGLRWNIPAISEVFGWP